MFPGKGGAAVVAGLAMLLLSGCGNTSSQVQGPHGCAGSTSCSASPTVSVTSLAPAATPDLVVLARYLNAVEHSDCPTAERFVHQPATGDLCAGGHLGTLQFDQWRNPSGLPTPSCCVAYAVSLHLTHEAGDAKLPRWETRAFTLQPYPAGYRIVAVGTITGP